MNVAELRDSLEGYDDDQEVYICHGGNWAGHTIREAGSVGEESHTIGIFSPSPTTRTVVVIDTEMCGL